MNRRRRWRWWWLPALLLALLLAGEASGWFFLRGPAESLLTSRLGREVRLAAPFRLHLLGAVRLELGGLWIAAPAGFDLPHLLDAEGLAARLRYGDLLALREPEPPLRVASLAAERLDARLIRLADGRASWEFAAEPSAAGSRPPPIIEHLGLRQGDVVLRDPTLDVDLSARVATREGGEKPATVAEISGSFRERPVRASLTVPNGLPPSLTASGSEPMAVEGRAEYGGMKLNFTGAFGVDELRSDVAITGPSLGLVGRLLGTPLPATGPFSLQGEIVRDSPVWQVTVKQARVGDSQLSGTFTYDTGAQPPRLDGELAGRNFLLADLAPAFGTRDGDGARVRPPAGRTLPDRRLDLPSLRRLDARVAVKLDRVDLGAAFSEPIAPLRATLTLDGGQMALADLEAVTAQGRLSGRLAVDASAKQPQWRADLAWDNVRLDRWLKAAKPAADDIPADNRKDAPPSWFTGSLHGRAQLVGQGHSTADLLASVDGRATVFVRNGSLSRLALEAMGLDIAQGLGLLVRGDRRQPVDCAVLDVDVKNGRLKPRVGIIATPVTVVMLDGSINFADERLDLRLTAKPQNMSPLTLRSPIRISGTFADPEVAPEATPIAARALGALGLALLNPLAAILPFVDFGEPDAMTCSQALAGARLPKAR